MRMLSMAALGMALVAPALVCAQGTDVRPTPVKATPVEPEFSFGQMTPTPDMWLYQQALRRYSDRPPPAPAEFDADQRQARLAAQRGSVTRSRARLSARLRSPARTRRCGLRIHRSRRTGGE